MWKMLMLLVVAPMSFIIIDQVTPKEPTFEERWEPVYEINSGIPKGVLPSCVIKCPYRTTWVA